jgi:hypothetical protein
MSFEMTPNQKLLEKELKRYYQLRDQFDDISVLNKDYEKWKFMLDLSADHMDFLSAQCDKED